MRRGLLLGILAVLVVSVASSARADDRTIADLKRVLVFDGRTEAVVDALDELTTRIGTEPTLRDRGAFGDWLGELPPERCALPPIALRRAWAYVSVDRGAEAVPLLLEVLPSGYEKARAQAYLGEAKRQAGEPAEAIEMFALAAESGYDEAHLLESVRKVLFELRAASPPASAEGLPAYAEGFSRYLRARPTTELHILAASWMLEDLKAYAKTDGARRRLWARFVGEQALAAVRADPEAEGIALLCLDAARALDEADRAAHGETACFDLLAWVYRLGRSPGGHAFPGSLCLLARVALREGRFELAARLARERLALGDSPAARRILEGVPVDLPQ